MISQIFSRFFKVFFLSITYSIVGRKWLLKASLMHSRMDSPESSMIPIRPDKDSETFCIR